MKRAPFLTRREQGFVLFLLALLVTGGIVQKIRSATPHEEIPLVQP